MRLSIRLSTLLPVAVALTALTACYKPGDLGDMPFKCSVDYFQCPDGYTCNGRFCVYNNGTSFAVTVDKPSVYEGARAENPAFLNGCPSASSAHDSIDGARALSSRVDGESLCVKGRTDVWRASAADRYVRVRLSYTVKYGDLDLAILDGASNRAAVGDGSAVDNGCVASRTRLTDPYIAVVGALNADRNTYGIELETSDVPLTCP